MIADTARASDALRPIQILRYTALVYAVAFLAHTADHFRRGLDVLTPEVLWLGTAGSAVAVLAIALALAGSPLAPLLAVVHGFSQALGVAAVHLLPSWGAFSDSLHHGADVLSWTAVLAEISGALAFGVAGAYAFRHREQYRVARAMPATPRRVE
jgi:hypothetical protein